MSDSSFHFGPHGRVFDRVRNTVSKLARVNWIVSTLAFAGVVTVAWIGFLLWAAFKVLEWLFS